MRKDVIIMKTRILLITQWFDPEPTFKGIAFARELLNKGFDVEVLTGFPNYPGGNVYPGYKIRFLQRELIDGVHITRLPLYPDHGRSSIKRVLNYASFATSVLIYGLFLARRANVIYAYHPPLTVGVSASLIKLIRRMPLVYDIQDMWPDTLRATGMISNEKILSFVSLLCNLVYKCTDKIVVLSPGFKSCLINRGVPEDKIEVIYNWADEISLTSPEGELAPQFPGKQYFRILFAGNMGKAQALGVILEAAVRLKAQSSNVCFVLQGGGIEAGRLKETALKMELDNVVFMPPVPMSEVGVSLKAADALLVHLCDDPLFEITIPSKTQAYMAVGKPVLMAVNGDAAQLVVEAECGVIAKSDDASDIARAAFALSSLSKIELDKMGYNGRNFYDSHLSLKVGVSRFAEIFRIFAR